MPQKWRKKRRRRRSRRKSRGIRRDEILSWKKFKVIGGGNVFYLEKCGFRRLPARAVVSVNDQWLN